jgi:signal peptidase II
MAYLFMLLAAAGVVVADQWSKLWVVENLPLYSRMDAIDGVFHLTYVQNTGAAFSSFQGMQWLFAVVFLLFTAGIIWEFSKKRLPFTGFDRWCIALVYAGGLGNMIDRIRLGYVVDMICVDFMDFPVFNVADCFITCGSVLLLVHLFFFNKAFWKDEKK